MAEYKGLKGTLERLTITDAQAQKQIEQLIEQHPRLIPVTDRPSRLDDEVVLDYAGYVDGEQFEGGTAQMQTLVLGSGMFIPGFEDQLVGKRPGDQVDVHVTFPAQYHAPDLAGKEAVFKCVIHEVRVRDRYAPGDDFAREVFGMDSYDALMARMKRSLQAYADQQAEEELSIRLIDQVAVDFDGDIPQEALDRALDLQLQSLEAQLQRQGLTLDAYCQFTGKTREQLRADHLPDARKAVTRERAIDYVAQAEHIEADEESVAQVLQQICRENGVTMDQLAAHMDENAQAAIIRNVITQKALRRVRELAEVEVREE